MIKIPNNIGVVVVVLALLATGVVQARDPDSIEYYLAHVDEHTDQEIKLDVSHVVPTKFVSPVQDVAFLHVVSLDDVANRPGGSLLLMLPADEQEKIVDKYGLNHKRGRSRKMEPVLRVLSAQAGRKQYYILDYNGEMAQLVGDQLAEVGRLAASGRDGAGRQGRQRP